ncbi:MAG: methylmalonyl-CoA mutase family protein [Crocinitomicaceae bacterium]|nr:methylmalonyl-CoA mutase family protein [Crocinitomicaceae bacterium]
MSDFFKEFNKISKLDWENKIITDLKGKDPSIIAINNEIEELNLSSYYHAEDVTRKETPGNFPYTRGMNKADNSWQNGAFIIIKDEKEANKKSLKALNSGADLLVFKTTKANTNWKDVISGIQFEYIHAQFVIDSKSDFDSIYTLMDSDSNQVQYNLDIVKSNTKENFNSIAENFKSNQQAFCSVNGFKLQNIGANTSQEIAFCLNIGHNYLVRLMSIGFTIDEAAKCVSFKLGVGSNFFFETSKFRALKQLWSKVINAYNPQNGCSHNANITAVVGHLNKSLKDPYTNVLRQTTEAMSAINGGAEALVVKPYDIYSNCGPTELAERMALNISSILKEESYLNAVIDPLGGSYSIESATEAIARNAWKIFQKLELADDGIQSDWFLNSIKEKAALRIKNIKDSSSILIGINKFENPEKIDDKWDYSQDYLGLPAIILENALTSETL